jgi:flavin reductase (DIM6/NTAB) family NADH-FMN oxidoreductase RutF
MSGTKSFDPQELAQAALHGYLLSAVAPRPICFASTINAAGEVNLSPFSFFNVFSSNPPVMIFSPARRGRDNTVKHSYENVKEVAEVTISVVNYAMVEQMSLASTEYAKGVNEFEKAGFTQVPSELVKPPRVGEAPVNFECKVTQVIELGDGPGAGNLVLAEVVRIHVQEKYIQEGGGLNTPLLDLVGRMGGSWYTRASRESLFEIPKPLRTLGIGVDSLPESVRSSTVLSGNQLGRLGNSEELPTVQQTEQWAESEDWQAINSTEQGHQKAAAYLEQGMTEKALALLIWVANNH